MATSEETLRSPEMWRPSKSVITRSSGDRRPLFIHVGVLRIVPLSNRTERLPSQATMYSRSYIQRPAMQISRRCWDSLLEWPGDGESRITRSLLVADTSAGSRTQCPVMRLAPWHAPDQ